MPTTRRFSSASMAAGILIEPPSGPIAPGDFSGFPVYVLRLPDGGFWWCFRHEASLSRWVRCYPVPPLSLPPFGFALALCDSTCLCWEKIGLWFFWLGPLVREAVARLSPRSGLRRDVVLSAPPLPAAPPRVSSAPRSGWVFGPEPYSRYPVGPVSARPVLGSVLDVVA